MICCFTGHRNIEAEHMLKLSSILDYEIEKLIICGVTTFRGGGALGFDTLAELKVLEKKSQYDFLRLELVLPCRDQTQRWSERNRDIYEYIAARADSVKFVTESYSSGCMRERNRHLVNGSDFCLAYCRTTKGGSAYTCDYALKNGVQVINLFDKFR